MLFKPADHHATVGNLQIEKGFPAEERNCPQATTTPRDTCAPPLISTPAYKHAGAQGVPRRAPPGPIPPSPGVDAGPGLLTRGRCAPAAPPARTTTASSCFLGLLIIGIAWGSACCSTALVRAGAPAVRHQHQRRPARPRAAGSRSRFRAVVGHPGGDRFSPSSRAFSSVRPSPRRVRGRYYYDYDGSLSSSSSGDSSNRAAWWSPSCSRSWQLVVCMGRAGGRCGSC